MTRIAFIPALALLAGFTGGGEDDDEATPRPAAEAVEVSLQGDAAIDAFDRSDASAWSVVDDDDEPALQLGRSSRYSPPHRSPLSIALVHDHEFGDFDLELEAKQTGREYGHRDLCFFFGFQSPERFYYVHLATTPDKNAHNVFLVDQAARRNLLAPQEHGVDWGTDEWHRVKVERRVEAGTIRVWFDDMSTPILEVEDDTLTTGRVGVGSFDDTGRFRRIRVFAPGGARDVADQERCFASATEVEGDGG